MKTAVIILGHGSRSGDPEQAIKKVAAAVRAALGSAVVEHAFLQYLPPAPQEMLERCIAQGAARIVFVPFFLQAGTHVTRDIPELVAQARKSHPGVEIIVTDFVGSHPLMAKIVKELVVKDS